MNDSFNPLDHPICLELPLWLQDTSWAEHIPFAMFIMSAMRPRTFVELGSFRGVSYCAFCQSAKASQTGAKCYAVDTWQGDSQAGFLEDNVLDVLKSHHDPLYGNFSQLLQATFDEALTRFENKSIDLLHIDGFHTYEAVSHDFTTWLPKMSERGVVLFHDTNVRDRDDFGVWKFWGELTGKYPNFEFLHCYGLGVLAVGTEYSEGLKFLFEAGETQTNTIRTFFHRLGANISATKRIKELENFKHAIMSDRPMRIMHSIRKNGIVSYLKFQRERIVK